ncbi:hypothetical protein OGZ01_26120 [Vibrio harveyi]|nr:hypothetical protein [Vibrio harveyi]
MVNARISVMGGEQAAGVLTQVRREVKKRQGEEWYQSPKKVHSENLS